MPNKKIDLILCILFGYLGAHKFYEGKKAMGLLYLFTFGLCGIGWIVDILIIAFDKQYIPVSVHTENRSINFYNHILEEDKRHGVTYEKNSKIVSLFNRKWYDRCSREFVVLDFETTGLDKAFDRIIEVAAIRFVDGEEKEKYVTLVKPPFEIPIESTAVNHITNGMVRSSPSEDVVIPELIKFIGDSLIVGHNVNFDVSFLEIAARRLGKEVSYNYIDTMSVSKKLFPNLENYKLGTVAQLLDIDTGKLHRAEADVYVCAEIIKTALNSLSDDFDSVSKELKAVRQSASQSCDIKKAELEAGQKRINRHINEVKSDLIVFYGSRLCPCCSIYNHRIFSKSGKDKRFPSFSKLPDKMKVTNCPECGVFIGFGAYHADNFSNKLKDDIKKSNRPFNDSRTAEEKRLYAEKKQSEMQTEIDRSEFEWLCLNLEDKAPKSLSGYRRMKNAKSANFLKLVEAAADKGYQIQQ